MSIEQKFWSKNLNFFFPILFPPFPWVVSCALQEWPLSAEGSNNVAGDKNMTQSLCLLPDAAFLAREKARADAECYTAMKVAEANKVLSFPLWGNAQHRDQCLNQKAKQGHLLSAELSSETISQQLFVS